MPQVGERRAGATETVEWNGQRWEPVSSPAPDHSQDVGFSNLIPRTIEAVGAVPDIVRGLTQHPVDTLKGFFSGAAGAATPTKLGTLAALTTGGASIPAQMLTAGGAEALGEFLQTVSGSPDAPQSLGEGVGRSLGAAGTAGALTGAARLGGSAYRALKNSRGVVDAALEAGSHVPGLKTVSRVGQAARDLVTGGADEAPAGVERFGPMRRAREVPGSYYHELPPPKPAGTMFGDMPIEPHTGTVLPEAQFSPRLVGKAPQLNDVIEEALQGLRDDASPVTRQSGRIADTPSVRRMDELQQKFQRGPDAPAAATTTPTGRTPGAEPLDARVDAAADNLRPDRDTDGMLSFSKFSDSLDPIINDAAADPLERTPNWRSKPTNAEKASMQRRQQADPHYPYRELDLNELFNRR